MQASTDKVLFLTLIVVFGRTHFAIQFVACWIYVQLNRQSREIHGIIII